MLPRAQSSERACQVLVDTATAPMAVPVNEIFTRSSARARCRQGEITYAAYDRAGRQALVFAD
jgi:hypothetical protein